MLFKHFTSEIIPALIDVGGGSGTGALFMDEGTWPAKYNKVPMMADWGRNSISIHRVTPDGPTFTQEEEKFIGLAQPTVLDVDGSGQLYIAAWDGAGYKGNPGRGFVERVVPKGWKYKAFPDLTKLSMEALVKGLTVDSGKMRLAVQQEILGRNDKSGAAAILSMAKDQKNSLAGRVAALFTYKQLLGAEANNALLALSKIAALGEFALRALADRLSEISNVPQEPFYKALGSSNPRAQAAAIIALGRLSNQDATKHLLALTEGPDADVMLDPTKEGPHATPNPSVVLPHLAVQALVRLKAVDACLDAVDSSKINGALWALHLMHEPAVVDGLIEKFHAATNETKKKRILATLGRLYTKEAPYDGSCWWNTQPDTRGPYYVPMKWAASSKIEKVFRDSWASANSKDKEFLTYVANRNRMSLAGIGKVEELVEEKTDTIGTISIENVMLALDDIKGDPTNGKEILRGQACIACHSIEENDPKRGPDLNQVGRALDREAIAESILKPDAVISDNWVDVTTQDGTTLQGTLVEKSAEKVIVRNIAGETTSLVAADVKSIKKSASTLMGPHLLDSLTMEEFADVISYLHSLK